MTPHHKHIIWAVAAIVMVVGGLAVRGKYEAIVADRVARQNEQISANQVKVAEAQKSNKSDQDAITARNLANAKEVAYWKAQAAQGLTQAQADALIAQRLAGLGAIQGKDAQGEETTTVPTAGLADLLNTTAANQHICDSNLGTCEADKATLNGIIARNETSLKTDQDTIGKQANEITELKKYQVPRWTIGIGVSKTPGATFQSVNSYQGDVWANYRLGERVGVWGGVQNRGLAGGVSFAVGNVAK